MNLNDCLKSALDLTDDDSSMIVGLYDEIKTGDVDDGKAASQAVEKLLKQIDDEIVDIGSVIDEQHPELRESTVDDFDEGIAKESWNNAVEYQKKIDAKSAWDEIIQKQRKLEGMKAAIRDPVTGKVYTGWSHQAAIETAPKWNAKLSEQEQGVWGRLSNEWDRSTENSGFIDSDGNFISRDEAEKQFGVSTMEDIRDARKK